MIGSIAELDLRCLLIRDLLYAYGRMRLRLRLRSLQGDWEWTSLCLVTHIS